MDQDLFHVCLTVRIILIVHYAILFIAQFAPLVLALLVLSISVLLCVEME
jgi:hypothetical protein